MNQSFQDKLKFWRNLIEAAFPWTDDGGETIGVDSEAKIYKFILISKDDKNNEPYSYKFIQRILDIILVKKIINWIADIFG